MVLFNVVSTVAGNPGTGKTTSTRNLTKSAIIYNVENKELPFPKKQNGPTNYPVTHPTKMLLHLPRVMLRPDIETIVLDSFSDTVDFFKHKTTYEDKKTGFDIYRGYNEMIFALFQLFKNLPNKYVFAFGHSETFDTPEGKVAYLKVDGNMYAKAVEKFAVVAFHTHKGKVTDAEGKSKFNYSFEYDSADYCTKAPMGMFEGEVQNDLDLVVKRYQEYWGHPTRSQKILAYQDVKYREEIMDRMEKIKNMYVGPLKIDEQLVTIAFNEAYATLEDIIKKVVMPEVKRHMSGAVAVEKPQAQSAPGPQPVTQQAPSRQPAPAPVPQPQFASPALGIPAPGMSISAVDEVLNSI